MPKRRTFIVTVLVAAIALPTFLGISRGDDSKSPEAQAAASAAKDWLREVDDGAYERSWDSAATYFQKAITKDQWAASLAGVRRPLGRVLSRELIGAQKATKLPGAPDGDYVVLQFRTSFEKKKSAIETVTPMKDGARGYRVSGYYIK